MAKKKDMTVSKCVYHLYYWQGYTVERKGAFSWFDLSLVHTIEPFRAPHRGPGHRRRRLALPGLQARFGRLTAMPRRLRVAAE